MEENKILSCDYLIIGAGAASLAFIDTLLQECPNTKIILVDKGDAPGGHWVHDYDFVRLHQPSLVYGLSSRQLEGNWLRLLFGKFTLPWQHRATKQEILDYFGKFVQDLVDAGNMQYFAKCQYNFDDQQVQDDIHKFSSLNGEMEYFVKVNIKLVNGVLGECIIPSQQPLQFPVEKGITVMTPNQIYDNYICKSSKGGKRVDEEDCFVVLGNGKTAMDTVVFLQKRMKVKPGNIFWIISNDVWMLAREGSGSPWSWPQALLDCDGDVKSASLALEKSGALVRMDKRVLPSKFRFPIIGKDELRLMQRIQNPIRRGRVIDIRLKHLKDDHRVAVSFTDGQDWMTNIPVERMTFIHCTSPGPFNGNNTDELFPSEKEMNLFLLFAPPVSISMSVLAYLEACRLKGSLDIMFGRHLLNTIDNSSMDSNGLTDNQVLNELIRGLGLSESDPLKRGPLRSIVTLAMFLAIASKDPLESYNWISSNRLSLLSIPGTKCGICQNLDVLIQKGKTFDYKESELQMFCLLREKLEPLRNK